jgi:Uma2 family endonuclease
MSSLALQRLTAAEYLEIERNAEHKSEFYNGEMFAMAGASLAHVLITDNVARELGNQLRESPCLVLSSDMRVKVTATGLYTYPDVVVVCDPPAMEGGPHDTLLNPTLIVEVLSPSTEAYDRGEKFAHFRRLASLQEYVLIAQDRRRIERYVRQEVSEEWLLTEVSDPQGRIALPSIGCTLALEAVYDKVPLPEGEHPLR